MDNMPHMPKQNKVKNAVTGSFFLVTLISRRFFKTDSGGLLETMTNNAAVSGGTVVLFLYPQNQTNYFLSKKRSEEWEKLK